MISYIGVKADTVHLTTIFDLIRKKYILLMVGVMILKEKNNEAVSPVVGVMLMLVVTIIIAAVVSSFAGGLAGEQKKAPSITIDVRLYTDYVWDDSILPNGENPEMWFEHIGGESVPTSELMIVTYYVVPSTGEVIKHTVDGSLKPGTKGNPGNGGYPALNDMSVGPMTCDEVKFGRRNWATGDLLEARSGLQLEDVIGFDPTKDEYEFGKGSVVEVKILHKSSGQYIYQNKVSAI